MIVNGHPQFELHRDAAGRLVLTDQRGKVHIGVEPVQSFPISEPQRWVSLIDAGGRELVSIGDLAEVPPPIRDLILQELADREFLPRIERLVRVLWNKDPHVWEVITDRGPVQFLHREDDIRRLGPHRAILLDMHGVRYYIPDSRQLDAKSRRILSQYL
jgi:uncharacterized protein DUF1854